MCSESHEKRCEWPQPDPVVHHSRGLTRTRGPEHVLGEPWLGERRAAVTFQTGEGRGLLPGTFGGQCEVRKTEARTVVPIEAAYQGVGRGKAVNCGNKESKLHTLRTSSPSPPSSFPNSPVTLLYIRKDQG